MRPALACTWEKAVRCQVGHLMMMMQAGFMPTEHTRKSLKLFAEEVYPAIRELGEPRAARQQASA
jgi:hypothetical protein